MTRERHGTGGATAVAPERSGPAPELLLSLPADPARLAPLRHAVVRWARALGADDVTLADLQLAVGEAAANGVEHAYPDGAGQRPDAVEVALWLRPAGPGPRGAVIAVRVRDGGRWQRPAADPGYRGRGLQMIRAVAVDVVVAPGPTGTEISFAVPLGARS